MTDEVEVKAEEVVADTLVDAPVDAVEAPVADVSEQPVVDDIKTDSTSEPVADTEKSTNEDESSDDKEAPHPALSLLDKLEAKLFFVETAIATEIKQVIEEIKSHL